MSYNVLADGLATADKFPQCSERELDFNFRAPRVIQEVIDSEAGIICFQEMNHIEDYYEEKLKELGFQLIRNKQESKLKNHEIAIAIKTSQYTLLDFELINLNDVASLYDNDPDFKKDNQAMLCLLRHSKTQKNIVVGNARLHWNPEYDYVKFAQAHFVVDKTAEYMRMNGVRSGSFSEKTQTISNALPLILCGDFNALPVSSALSAFYGENIEDESSSWKIPSDLEKNKFTAFGRYKTTNKLYKRKLLLK